MVRISNNSVDVKTRPVETVRRALNTTGLRLTNQRAVILEIIRHESRHLDADEVYSRAREKHPRLSLSTVYRTLRLLKKLDLVEELHLDEAHRHYEVKPSSEHHHLICLGCGKIIEFKCPLAEKMREDVSREKDFEVTAFETRMTGYCSRCRKMKK